MADPVAPPRGAYGIAPQGDGSVVDVRSLSRVGGSDFGTNAKRVRAYLKRVATASGAA